MLGLALGWVILLWVAFRIRRWGLRFLETHAEKTGTGKKWEQDKPMAECFDDMPRDADPTDDWWND